MPPPLTQSCSIQISEPFAQYSLFDDTQREAIVNVASVPQRSPFRYPGGKTWLVPRLRRWISSLPEKPIEFLEPFAGGGIISLTAAFEGLAKRITMVELDKDVASVWQTILSDDAEWLAGKIVNFSMTPDAVREELERSPRDTRRRAFQTLLRNRINHGGILAPGSGKLKHGENGKGLTSRWYPQTLCDRILNIATIKDRIRFVQGDGLDFLQQYTSHSDAVFFIDPPYTAAGKKAGARLYTCSEIDHEQLFQSAAACSGDFLMTYDNTEGVVRLAERHGFATQAIPMKNTHHAEMTEILISRHLDWA